MQYFSLSSFTRLIKMMQDKGIRCCSFHDGADQATQSSICLMRHDVDLSIQYAVRLARHESDLGITSTYFVQVNSDLYNTFSRANEAALREIVALGHEVGLHWWRARYPANRDHFARAFRRHLDLLGEIVGQPIFSAAQHDPVTDDRLSIADLVAYDAYDPKFFQSIPYVSDSNRCFRTDPFQLVETGVRCLQLNLHPLYWVADSEGMAECCLEAFAAEENVARSVLEHTIAEYEAALRDRQQRDQRFQSAYQLQRRTA